MIWGYATKHRPPSHPQAGETEIVQMRDLGLEVIHCHLGQAARRDDFVSAHRQRSAIVVSAQAQINKTRRCRRE
jgi:hypothetical protein